MKKNAKVNCNCFMFLINLFGIILTFCCVNSSGFNYNGEYFFTKSTRFPVSVSGWNERIEILFQNSN